MKRFLKENEGKFYLWYSSRKELKNVIEEEMKPLLNVDYDTVYNNRNKLESNMTVEQLRYCLLYTSRCV